MEDPVDVVIGGAFIAAGVIVSGMSFGAATPISGVLFSFGAGMLASGVGLGPDAQKGIMLETRSTDTPIPVVYGTTKVGAHLTELRADPATAGDDQFAGKVVSFAVGSENGSGIEDVLEVRLDEELAIEDPAFSRDQTSTNVEDFFGDKLQYSLHRGSDDQLSPIWLENRYGSDVWDESGRGRGIAMLGLALTFDQEVFPGVPTAQLLVKGNRVYDPRDPTGGPDSDGFAFSNNPWLILLDYLTSKRYGLDAAYSERDGGDVSEIDEQSFIDAANHADEVVPFTKDDGTVGSHARHTFDGWLPTAEDENGHKNNITRIVQSTGGMLVHQSGKWRAVPKRPTAAVDYTLSEANIIGDWSGSRSGIRDAPSRIRAEFADSSRSYQANDVHWPETNAPNPFRDADNSFPSTLALQLPGVTSRARAQRMAQVALKEARADKTFTFRADESALQLQVGDVVPLKHPTPGYTSADGFPDGKKFWIVAQQIFFEDESLQVGLSLREYDPDAYVTELGSPPEEPGDPVLPDPRPGPIDVDLIGAWMLGFPNVDGACNPPTVCAGGECLCDSCDPRRSQYDFSGNGNTGAITKATGFKFTDMCYRIGPAGYSFQNADGGGKVSINGSSAVELLQLSNPEGGNGFSAMGWFYSTSTVAATAHFGQKGDSNNEGWAALIDADGDIAQFLFYGQDGTQEASTTNIEDAVGRKVGQDEWVHYAVIVHPCDSDGNFTVDVLINGRWIGSRGFANGPIVPATNVDLGWGAGKGNDPNDVAIVGRMNQGLIYDGVLSRQDVAKVHGGETTNPTPASSVTTIDDLGDGQDYARVRQEWTEDGRPQDWIDDITIREFQNDTCAGGGGLQIRATPSYTSIGADDEDDWRVYVDWYEDGTHVHQQNTQSDIWNNITGGAIAFRYTDSSTGSDAGDATEHTIRVHVTLMDMTGSDPVAVDSKSASIRATYGFSC